MHTIHKKLIEKYAYNSVVDNLGLDASAKYLSSLETKFS